MIKSIIDTVELNIELLEKNLLSKQDILNQFKQLRDMIKLQEKIIDKQDYILKHLKLKKG